MKKRILSMLLVLVMLVGMLPIQAFAMEATDQTITPCETEGCEFASGHEGNCSNYVAPTEACATEGCTYGANHEGNCSNYVAPTEGCTTEGCTYGANHEGNCSNYVAPTEGCTTEGCTYGANHEGNCSNYVAPTEACATEGCTYGANHEGNCSNYVAPTEACATEGCTYGANHEGNCSNYVAPVVLAVPAAPAAPAGTEEVTFDSVTLKAVEGESIQYGYAVKAAEGEEQAAPANWQESTAFTGLKPGVTYLFYTRLADDEEAVSETALEVTTKALTVAPVLSQTVAFNASRTILLTVPEACTEYEGAVVNYSMSSDGGETWTYGQSSPMFTGLSDNVEYQFRAHYLITQYSHLSPYSNVITVKAEPLDLTEDDLCVETGHSPSVKNSMRFTNIYLDDATKLKTAWDADTNTLDIVLAADTDRTKPITIAADGVTGGYTFSVCYVALNTWYGSRVGTIYPNDGSTTEGQWVYTMTPDWDENGRASYTFVPYAGTSTANFLTSYTVNLTISSGVNSAPSLRDGVSAEKSSLLVLGESHNLILDDLFEDVDLDDISYTVSVDGADPVEASGTFYAANPTTTGEHTYVFKAKDSTGVEATDTYTLKLTVYELTSIETNNDGSSNAWNANISKIYIDSTKVERVVEDPTGNVTAYVLMKPDINKEDPIFLRADILMNYTRFTGMKINGETVDGQYENVVNPVWSGTYTPTWDESNEATLTFVAQPQSNNKYSYTIKLKIPNAENQAPKLTGDASKTEEVHQYDTLTVDVASLFTDADDTTLFYYASVGDGEAEPIGTSYSYRPLTVGEHVLKFYAEDLAGAKSQVYTLTYNAAEYVMPAGAYGIRNAAETGELVNVTILDSDGNVIEDVTFTAEEGENGEHIINAKLPGTMTSGSKVTAKFYVIQNEEQVPFLSRYCNNGNYAKRNKVDSMSMTLNPTGSTTVYWYETAPEDSATTAEEGNVYETYIVNCEIDREDNKAPVLAEGVSGMANVYMDQYTEYKLDLSTIFIDPEGDSVTYSVSVDSGEYTSTGSSYTYKAETSGTIVLDFKATDGFGAESRTYTVILRVKYIPRLIIETGDAGHKFGGTITQFSFQGYEIEAHNLIKLEDNKNILVVQLADSVADDAQLEIVATTPGVRPCGVNWNPGSTVTLEGGKATVEVESTGSFFYGTHHYYTIIFTKEANALPALAEGVESKAEANITTGDAYSVDLSQIFTDANGDTMSYTVSVDGADAVTAEASYTYTTEDVGTKTLVFTASDNWGAGATYTVKLNVVNNDVTYDVTVKVPDTVTPSFYATTGWDKDYHDTLGVALNAVQGESADGWTTYTVAVPENISQVSVRGTDAANEWGGMSFAVEKDMAAITLRRVQAVINSKIDTDDGKAAPTAEQAAFLIKYGENRYAVSGSTGNDDYGYLYYRFLLVAADNSLVYTYYTVPKGDLTGSYTTNEGLTKTVTTDSADVMIATLPLGLKNPFTVTAPTGATVVMYKQLGYFNYDTVPAAETVDNGDGTKTATFNVTSGIYRVSMEGEITKAGYASSGDTGVTITWENDDRGPSYRAAYDTSTLLGSRGDDSMYVNVNYRNNLQMAVDGEFRLRAWRIWEIINTDTTNIMIEPDFNYTVISGQDVISITPTDDAGGIAGQNWLDIKGLKAGTAILEVSYDAIDIGASSMASDFSNFKSGFTFNASDPARTALIVVQVGAAENDINFGFKLNRTDAWDVEMDTLYFVGEKGEIQLKPTVISGEGAVAKVEVSNDKGASYTVLTAGEDGYYTADIVSGNNIIRVTKTDGSQHYQVVRGDKITMTISEVKNASDQDGIVEAGEKIRIDFDGVHNVVGKMSGIYNPTDYKTNYTFNGQVYSGSGGQYTYPNAAYVEVIVPGTAAVGEEYTLTNGNTTNGGWGSSGGAHRDASGEVPPGLDADTVTNNGRNIFPEITLTVGGTLDKEEIIDVEGIELSPKALELEVGKNSNLTASVKPANATDKTVTWKSSNESVATVNDGVVTAVSKGTATITASAGGFSDTCAITVVSAKEDKPTTDFGLDEDEIVGYVTVSFEDYGVRVEGEDISAQYATPRGVIVAPTKVPFKAYDTIASVTLRLLKAKGITASYQGSEFSGFYLSAIDGFGEFDAGIGSGWMITQNDVFINKGASEFMVKNGDVIEWQYTCQLGADIGDSYSQEQVNAVEALIETIGTVTTESGEAIEAAREAYDALTDVQKKLVENYEKLTEAEATFAQLIKTEEDEAAADAVESLIDAIGTVTLDSEEKIAAARAAYDALTETQKALVENLAVLEAAEETLALLKLAGTDITDIYKTTGDYLAALSAPTVGSTNGEWRVIGLARAGRSIPDSYYDAVVKYVQDNIDENGRLHAVKSTDNSRIIVALTAIGKDVTDVGGYDLLSGLNDMEYIGKQGINGTIWALIAFDSHDYAIPAGDVTREKLVQDIVDAQLAGGGWALSGVAGDPDMTGMALQALAPYYNTNSGVKAAIDKALTWLSGIQNQDGTFSGSEGTTSESLAQVITGLTALGINPETDSRFIKNGVSAVDALSAFYVDGGGFKHGLTGERNMMATEQGYYALVSYYRLLQDKTSLYDMSDVTIQTAAKDQEAADAVEALIDAIGTVTAESGEAIEAARTAYDALTDAQKELVENYKTLTDAEAAYAQIVKTAADEAAAKAVEEKIDAIGTVTLDSEKRIEEARAAYDKLTAVQKALVSNLDKLEAAEKALADLKDAAAVDVVEKLISAIGTVTLDSENKIKAARKAYDALTEAQKKLVENYKTLTDAESKLNELKSTVSVTFTLLGCSKHGTDKVHTLADGNLSTWIATKTYMVAPGATVKDVLEKALKEAGMSWRNPTGNYVESINGIGEFTNGSNSGWMYTLNGTHPNLGVAEQTVKAGDVIVFHYTDDYTKEEGSQGYGDRDEAAAEKVEDLIDAIGTVTLNSKSKIDTARKAYDALTYTQKQLVDNYATLTAAEAKYAQLKAADDEKKADAVEDLIDAIMKGSATFEADVKAAQDAYNNLTADQKKLVDNYYKLAGYLKELADEEDKEAAEAVEKLISAIGTVTLDSEDEIKAAWDAYNNLTDEQKALVENLSILEAAEKKLTELKALSGVEDIYKTTGDYLEALGTPVPGSTGGEWMVIGLARSGREIEGVEDYYESAVKYVQENIDENERLHRAKSTENSRMILALTSIGKDVTNVGGHNLLNGLNSMEFIQKQGINGPIWALLAFDSGNYPIPEGDVSREALIQTILDAQLADGGWALSGEASDADITGMAVQALAPYYKTNADVKKALDEAVETISMMQAADGSFGSIDGTSSESIAQVITALSALGIDAHKDERFVKNGISAVDALCAFYVQGGGFKHIPEGSLDGMATEQGYYALTAYFRMLDGKTGLYNMTDVIDMGGDTEAAEPTETLPVETEPASTEPADTQENKGGFPWWLVIVIVVLSGAIVVLVVISKSKKYKYVR